MNRKFLIVVEGENFIFDTADENGGEKLQRLGFLVHLHLEAPDEFSAGERAVSILREDRQLIEMTRNQRSDPPTLSVNEVYELKSFEGCEQPRSSFIFFEMPSRSTGRKKVNSPKVKSQK